MKLVQICDEREAFMSEPQQLEHSSQQQPAAATASASLSSSGTIMGIPSINGEESSPVGSTHGVVKKRRMKLPQDNQELEVHLRDPLFFLLEDPSIDTTRAIIFRYLLSTIENILIT